MNETARTVILLAAAIPVAFAQGAVDPNPDPNAEAFTHFYNLEYDSAISEFRAFTVAHAESADGWNYLAQAIFYSALFDCGLMGSDLVKDNSAVLHSPKVVLGVARDEEMQSALNKAETIARQSLKTNSNDTSALYALGVSYGLRANYELLAKHAWLAGLKAANESRKLHEQVMKLDPNNYDARLVPGTHQYMVGTLPLLGRLAARAVGVTGNRAEGLKKVELVATHGARNRLDAQILLTVLYRREGRSEMGVPILRQLTDNYPRNFIFRIELAKLYADSGDRPHASAEVDSIDKLVGESAPGYSGVSRVAMIRRQEAAVGEQIAQLPRDPSQLASMARQAQVSANLLK